MAGDGRRAATWRRSAAPASRIILGLLLLWFLHEKGLLDVQRVGTALAEHPWWTAAAVLLHGVIFFLMALRWRYVAAAGRIAIPLWTSEKLTFVSHFFSTCLPGNGAGEVVKGILLSRSGIPFSEILGTMAIDRVAGMTGLFLAWNGSMAALAALRPEVRPLLLAILPFTFPVALLLLSSLYATSTLSGFAVRLARHTPRGGIAGRLASESVLMLERMRHCASRRGTVTVALLVSIGLQILIFLVAICAARSLSLSLDLVEAGAILPLASLANALPLSPGGIGIGESAASLALARLGHPSSTGAELMLVVRLAFTTWAVLGGILYMSTSFHRRPTDRT